jgi:hypothetical protein
VTCQAAEDGVAREQNTVKVQRALRNVSIGDRDSDACFS